MQPVINLFGFPKLGETQCFELDHLQLKKKNRMYKVIMGLKWHQMKKAKNKDFNYDSGIENTEHFIIIIILFAD